MFSIHVNHALHCITPKLSLIALIILSSSHNSKIIEISFLFNFLIIQNCEFEGVNIEETEKMSEEIQVNDDLTNDQAEV